MLDFTKIMEEQTRLMVQQTETMAARIFANEGIEEMTRICTKIHDEGFASLNDKEVNIIGVVLMAGFNTAAWAVYQAGKTQDARSGDTQQGKENTTSRRRTDPSSN